MAASAQIIYITISQMSILLPIVIGAMNYSMLNGTFRLFLWFFVISLLFEIQANVSAAVFKTNMPGLHLFTVVEMLVFSFIFSMNFIEDRVMQIIVAVNAFLFVLVALMDAFYFDGISHPNKVSRCYSSISLITYSLIYFYSLFKKDTGLYSWQYPMFWVWVGVLIYFGTNLFYFMLMNYLIADAAYVGKISTYTHAAVNIIANILFSWSFRCKVISTTR